MNNASSAQTHVTQLQAVPDLLALHAANSERYHHLLSSAAISAKSRFDKLFAFLGESLCLDRQGLKNPSDIRSESTNFLDAMADWWQCESTNEINTADLPYVGGWHVYLSYEIAAEIEPGLHLPADTSGLPVAIATRFQTAIIVDHESSTTYVVSESDSDHQNRVDTIEQDSELTQSVKIVQVNASFNKEPAETHLKNLEKIHRYIVDGDIFQANLSRLLQVQLADEISDSELYLLLKLNYPSPFSCVSTLSGGSIISSSPERLVSMKNTRIDTRPIAGTRPRSADEDADQLLSDELIDTLKNVRNISCFWT